MQILNKSANVRDDRCYYISSRSKVCDVNKEYVEKMISVFDELSREDKSVSNISDFVYRHYL